jgi:homoserine kinase type II
MTTQGLSGQEAPAGALAAFGLPASCELTVLTAGLMNRNWAVTCGDARYALKQILDVDAEQARRQHTAVTALADAGLPVAVPLASPGGATVVETAGAIWSLAPWIEGEAHPARAWTPVQATVVGELLGELHQALDVCMPAVATVVDAPVTELAKAAARISDYQARIAGLPERDGFDDAAAVALGERAVLLERFADQRPRQGKSGPAGWTHGDFHDLNLLWRDGCISAVLDWDRLGVRAYAAEVVRSATLMFGLGDERGLDLELVAAFAVGYRKAMGLGPEPLADAAERLWWERICDVWQLRRHYESDDTSCDHLFISASALIAWWCEHRGEVTEALTAA